MTSHGGRVGPMLAELEFRARRLRRGAAVSAAAPTGRLGSLPSVPVKVRVIRAGSRPSILGLCADVVLVVPAIQAESTRMVVLLPVFSSLLLVVAVVEMARRSMVPCLLQLMVMLVVETSCRAQSSARIQASLQCTTLVCCRVRQ